MHQLFLKAKDFALVGIGLAVVIFVIATAIILNLQNAGFFNQPNVTAADKTVLEEIPANEQVSEELQLSRPERLIIPSVNIGIDILNSTIDVETNEWPLSDDAVHYANFTSSLGNERGTLLLYGHNSWPVLRNTEDLSIGDSMFLVDENGRTWEFTLSEEKIITPEQVEFIYEDVPFRVAMFTCNGWADQYRRLMFFTPVS